MKRLFLGVFLLASMFLSSCNDDDNSGGVDVNYTANDFFNEPANQSKQTFTLSTTDLPKTVTLQGGTKITIKENTFTKGGVPISGDFTLKVREMLKRSDIISSGTNTNYSDGSPFISDGFLYLNVQQNGVNVDQLLAKNLLIEIPKPADLNRGTQLWEGTENAGEGENQFGWNNLPQNAINPNDRNGDVAQDGNWVGAKQGSVTFAFNLGKLGWFNCDVFWEAVNGKTTVFVTLTGAKGQLASFQGYTGDTFVFFCGKGTNVVAQLYTLDGTTGVKSYENSMPIGKEGKMIAFSIKEGRFYVDSKDITITANMNLTLDLKEVTKAQIQQLFEGLDNFN